MYILNRYSENSSREYLIAGYYCVRQIHVFIVVISALNLIYLLPANNFKARGTCIIIKYIFY